MLLSANLRPNPLLSLPASHLLSSAAKASRPSPSPLLPLSHTPHPSSSRPSRPQPLSSPSRCVTRLSATPTKSLCLVCPHHRLLSMTHLLSATSTFVTSPLPQAGHLLHPLLLRLVQCHYSLICHRHLLSPPLVCLCCPISWQVVKS